MQQRAAAPVNRPASSKILSPKDTRGILPHSTWLALWKLPPPTHGGQGSIVPPWLRPLEYQCKLQALHQNAEANIQEAFKQTDKPSPKGNRIHDISDA